jgi:hypothetical protein
MIAGSQAVCGRLCGLYQFCRMESDTNGFRRLDIRVLLILRGSESEHCRNKSLR